ncbi:hypothetical protein, partial [Salmonella enterica]|uniref:hypothetical protein n=1 Tax=Salmonella enterica TaxID=28901 RepID=UPI002ADEF50F
HHCASRELPGINYNEGLCWKTGPFVLSVGCRMAAPPYSAYRDAPIYPQYNHKPSQHSYGKLLPIEYQESSHDPLPKTLEYLRH